MKTATVTLILSAIAFFFVGCAGTTGSSRPASASSGIPAGMNAGGEVVDSSQVSEGHGRKVTGINGYSGEILGVRSSGSRFSKLEIGMTVAQVANILGTPSAQGTYITGQVFNPFNFGGGGTTRYELVYKNEGRLIFDSPSGYDFGGRNATGASHGAYGSGYLVWIINNAHETDHR